MKNRSLQSDGKRSPTGHLQMTLIVILVAIVLQVTLTHQQTRCSRMDGRHLVISRCAGDGATDNAAAAPLLSRGRDVDQVGRSTDVDGRHLRADLGAVAAARVGHGRPARLDRGSTRCPGPIQLAD